MKKDSVLTKMDLDFEDKNKNLDKGNEKFNSISESETVEFVLEDDINLEIKNEKPEKKRTPQSLAIWSLVKSIGWMFLIVLSLIFGSLAIRDFSVELQNFIDEVQIENNGWNATGQFFIMFSYIFEAGLFVFFIVYSTKMSFKNMIPFIIWRNQTKPERIGKKIILIKSKFEVTKQTAVDNGINFKRKEFKGELGSKSELTFYSNENKKIYSKVKKKFNNDKKLKKDLKQKSKSIEKEKKSQKKVEKKDSNIKDISENLD